MDAQADIRIPYKPKAWLMLVSVIFFGACLAVFLSLIFGGTLQGLTLMFYWAMAGMCVVFVVLGLMATSKSLNSRAEIVITDDAVSAPKSALSNKIIRVPFAKLAALDVMAVGRQQFLVVSHPGGKLNIAAQSLPTGISPEDLFQAIHERRETLMGQG